MRLLCLFVLSNLFIISDGIGQESISLFEKLYTYDSISITLTYPFDSLYKTQREEIEATLTIETADGRLMEDEPIKLNLRGKFRRMNCSMPPLLLNFKKSTLGELGLNKHDQIKLVTHCLKTNEGQENLLEERLCYQLYEGITPYAYRTIWLTVLYKDQLKPNTAILSTGFLIEPDKDIEDRLGIEEAKIFNPLEDSLDFETYGHAAAFNFLIGNRDWSIVMSRNAKLFFNPQLRKYVVIPYDFDYSNIVGASYRKNMHSDKMSDPKERIYQGEYFTNRAAEILSIFGDTETGVLHRILSSPGELSEKQRKKIYVYCETWYAYIGTRKPKELVYDMVMPYKGGL